MVELARAKRLGWNEGSTGNVTTTDILDPYDYANDDLEGEHVIMQVSTPNIGPYTMHLVDGQVADPESITPLTVVHPEGKPVVARLPKGTTSITPGYMRQEDYNPESTLRMPGDPPPAPVIVVGDQPAHTASALSTASPATLRSSGGATVTQVAEPEVEVTSDVDLGGKPSEGTKKDKRLKTNKKTSDEVTTFADGDVPPPQWQGVLVIEGSPTGDGREFATDAIEWADMPLPLRWQKVDSHGGLATNDTVRVGNITRVWRDGTNIMGEGFFDLTGPEDDDPHTAYRRMSNETLTGVSIDADDITDADIEYVFPKADDAEEGEEDDLFFLLFAAPEKIIFHAARIRAATLCDIPAFVEAQIHLIDPTEAAALLASAAVLDTTHSTATSDGTWDAGANELRLPARMTIDVAREVYATVDESQIDDGHVVKAAGSFIHHEVGEDGVPGPANLTACASGISRALTRDVYEHLARHLRDAGREPPQFEPASPALLAHAWHDEYRPTREWFDDPKLGQLMPIMVTDQGRVYGHAAQWGQCHLGYMSECVMPPHEDYHAYFLTGELPTDDGSRLRGVGQITAGIEHAAMPLRASSAKQHYENTDAVVADVVSGNDRHGIWVAGAIRPWAQTSRVAALRASGQVSPDWRRIGGELRMVALLTVNTSGYTVPRARALVAGGEIQTLVSSGMVTIQHHGPTEEELNKRALRLMQQQLADRVHGKV